MMTYQFKSYYDAQKIIRRYIQDMNILIYDKSTNIASLYKDIDIVFKKLDIENKSESEAQTIKRIIAENINLIPQGRSPAEKFYYLEIYLEQKKFDKTQPVFVEILDDSIIIRPNDLDN